MAERLVSPSTPPDIPRLKNGILEQWQQLPLEHQTALVPVLLGHLLKGEHGAWAQVAIETLQEKQQPSGNNLPATSPPETAPNTWSEQYFEDRLARLEPVLQSWARRAFYLEDKLTHDDILQSVRIVLWRRFSEKPEEWAAMSQGRWIAYAKETYRWKVVGFHRDGKRKLGMVASDMDCIINEKDITDDEAISMVHVDHAEGGHFAYPREIVLAELRIDLERAIERGMARLCVTQRRDMPKLLSDLLEGYTLEETCARYGWTRNRGVTLMRKLRTIFYEEMTGEKKTGYLGSHHPLTEAEKQRIRDLYATGLSYRKVAALVGRSPSAVEGVCKQYPPELVEQVRELLKEKKLSYAEIARKTGRAKSYIGWLIAAELREGTEDLGEKREGKNILPPPMEMDDEMAAR